MLPSMILGRNMPASNHGIMQNQLVNRVESLSKQAMALVPTGSGIQRLQHQSAQIQKLQIDAAIRLLQMEYNSILARMINQNIASQEQPGCGSVPVHVPNIALSTEAKSNRDETRSGSRSPSEVGKRRREEAEENEVHEAAGPSSHGKVILTCEVNHFFCSPAFSCKLESNSSDSDCMRNLSTPTEGLGKKRREI